MTVSIKNAIATGPCCTLDIAGQEQEQLVNMFKAAGNPIRFEILKYMLVHPGCITADIVTHLPLVQSTVSQHLKVLRQAGWIHGEEQGAAVAYCLNDENLAWFGAKVGAIL